jgi:hypothetical protein
VTDHIRPIGAPGRSAPPVSAVRRLTPKDREEAARERERRRRARQGRTPPRDGDERPPAGGGSLDVRA